jgi:Fe-S-cluster formation regulator IscX/YfhJ
LREAGMKVIGIGEKKTLNPFVTACDKFIYIEILKQKIANPIETNNKRISRNSKAPASTPLSRIDPEIVRSITDSIADLADENGWAYLGELGNLMLKKKPDFDPRNYGFTKMLPLIRSLNKFDIDVRETGKKNIKHIYVKRK